MSKSKPKVILLMGPTASGKTAAAVSLVQKYPCEIISVDSALVYKGMDIGTAKPDAATLTLAPHRLIDFLQPTEAYSAGAFRRDAIAAIAEIQAAGKIPLLVGGTMLYFHSLIAGLSELPTADEEVRLQLEAEVKINGLAALHEALSKIDEVAAARIHPNDSQRIQRAVEVYRSTGKTITQWMQESAPDPLAFSFAKIAINPQDRSVLHRRIEQRFRQMIAEGFIEEVQALRARGDLSQDMPSMRAVGYRQVWAYLEGEYNQAQMIEKGIVATRQLAKRQLTWLRRYDDLDWVDSTEKGYIEKITHQISNFFD